MSETETPAQTLRRAAERLRELDRAAGQAPWTRRNTKLDDIGIHEAAKGEEVACVYDGTDAALIVALRNSAPALAAWLDETAKTCELLAAMLGAPARDAVPDKALAVARAVLGETGATS